MLASALAAAVCAACASIPDHGPVVAGEPLPTARPPALTIIPVPPEPGADPEQIVDGFLAASDALDRFEVARQYLADELGRTWTPGPRLVYDQPPVIDVAGDRATVTVPVIGSIDADGVWTPRARTEQQFSFALTRDAEGEWRLSQAPADVLVSARAVRLQLRAFPVWFADRDPALEGVQAVPDLRWYPNRSDSATLVAEAVLQGPAAPLRGVARTGAPEGLVLGRGRVSVTSGVATVDLSAAYLDDDFASSRDAALLVAQLTRSLTQVPGVRQVRFTVEGRAVDDRIPLVLPVASSRTRPVLLRPSPVQAAGSDTGAEATPAMAELDVLTGELSALPGFSELADRVVRGLAVSDDGTFAAGVSAEGEILTQAGPGRGSSQAAGAQAVLAAGTWSPPAVDPTRWVWTSSAQVPPTVAGVAAGASVVAVAVNGTDARVVGFDPRGADVAGIDLVRPSPDGTRLLLVLRSATGAQTAQVRGVQRDADGRPVRLSDDHWAVFPEVRDITDAVWTGIEGVAVLGTRAGEDAGIWLSPVGGEARAQDGPENTVSLVCSAQGRVTVAVREPGVVAVLREGRWSDEATAPSAAC